MTPQELKNSILQLAIQGKLVQQRPEEGTAEELYQQLQKEKQALIKAGKIKKEKPLPKISEDEKPFDIPESWKWVRLGALVSKEIRRGKSPTYTPKSNVLVFAQKCNTKAGYIDISLCLYLDETKLSKYPKDEFMQDDDIVINSTGNGTLGRVGIYHDYDNKQRLPIVPDSHVTVIRPLSVLSVGYIYFGLKYYQPFMEKLGSGSTNQTELSAGIVSSLLFPLPPLAEQKRIVAKIEELLPLIDRYEAAYTRLEDFNKRFPGDMQKSILQMAIQGKLVEQRPEEGTGEELYQQIQKEKQALIKAGKIKKEKPLPEIAEDEKPFDIPESWKWVRFSEIAVLENGDRSGKYPVESDYVSTGIPFFGAKDIDGTELSFESVRFISKQKFDELGNGKLKDKDFIVLLRGSVGKSAIFSASDTYNTGFICAQMVILRCLNIELVSYAQCFMNSPYYKKTIEEKVTGTAVRQLPAKELGSTLIPLPPLAEQKRIVAKLEELLPLCERLK